LIYLVDSFINPFYQTIVQNYYLHAHADENYLAFQKIFAFGMLGARKKVRFVAGSWKNILCAGIQ